MKKTDELISKAKTHSIRFEISSAFIFTLIMAFGFCLVINLFFMEQFYVQNKREAIIQAYRSIAQAISDGDITSEEFDVEITHICERYNIEMIVLDADSLTIKSSANNAEQLTKILWDNILDSDSSYDAKEIIDIGEGYTLQIEKDRATGRKYLEMWGVVGAGNLILVRSTMESIKDSVAISNTFMAYVGVIAIVVGSVVILYISKKAS
mgnify:CR=1 FL=1